MKTVLETQLELREKKAQEFVKMGQWIGLAHLISLVTAFFFFFWKDAQAAAFFMLGMSYIFQTQANILRDSAYRLRGM